MWLVSQFISFSVSQLVYRVPGPLFSADFHSDFKLLKCREATCVALAPTGPWAGVP
jgi:hypothetical protein